MKGKVKEQWGKLTDDLDVIAGKQDQREGRLQALWLCKRPGAERDKRLVRSSNLVISDRGFARAGPLPLKAITTGTALGGIDGGEEVRARGIPTMEGCWWT